ncbi:rho GTPase-activating protein 21 [Elysia marginata]|uniref:Rho GTPase-activating protein 21 n=1 Tax=Elysia marginata TaxID=1093978 RepID=A0AAV4HV42_9GAST|nr:rho GTPase-activating protein 21 [Elysia marginata]
MQTPQQLVAQSLAQTQAVPQSSCLLSSRSVSPLPSQFDRLYQSETAASVNPISTSDSSTKDGYLCTSLSLPSPSSPMPSSCSSQSINSVISEPAADSGSYAPVAEALEGMASNDSCKILSQNTEGQHHGETQHFSSSGDGDVSVTMRKKIQESLEDQANKLHRRTSYLMATARDRTNTVPIEQAFSSPYSAAELPHLQSAGPTRHPSSVKLNKFFGEMIPSIAEGVEIVKSSDAEEAPEVIRKGPLSCKISVIEGKKCSDRSWKPVYAVLRQNELFLTREKDNPASSGFEDQHILLRSIMVEFARDYAKKKKHVFRMSTHNECEYLFQTEDRGTMLCWIQAIKSINDPEKAGKMEEMIASEQDRQFQAAPVVVIPSHKMSPQIGGHKGRKLSALSLKAKLSSSPSMRRKKSSVIEKDESIKKTWMGRISMMKSLKKHSDDSNSISLSEPDGDVDKMQFGVHLEDCFPSPHNQYVPLIVELCTRIVEARGLEVIGVYRVPGNSAAINALTEEFNRGIDAVNIDNEKLLDINVISSLLKSFFRKLEDPLVPAEYYESFIEANRHPDESKRKLKIKRLLHLLPPHHHETFRHMAEHLNKVASYGNMNKMDAKNLAIMFGPTLVRKKEDDTVSLVTDMSDQCRIVESIILHHDWFFSTWDQDNYIPMETTVETVNLENGQNVHKDEDEEADSAISTKELISSIVGAASKKLRSQKQAVSMDLVEDVTDIGDGTAKLGSGPETFSERNIDEAVYRTTMPKAELSSGSRSASEEFLDKKGSLAGSRSDVRGAIVVPVTPIMAVSSNSNKKARGSSSDPYYGELQYADATPPSPSLSSSTATGATNLSRYFSDESLLVDVIDSNDELDDEMEILNPGGRLPTSLSRDAIHDTLKRIGNDVSALLHTFEQKQQKERERRRREQERVEAEHRRTRLELEQEDVDEGFDRWFLAPSWKGSTTDSKDRKVGHPQLSGANTAASSVPTTKMPDVVSSSYLGEHYPYDHERIPFQKGRETMHSDHRGGMKTSSKTASNNSLPPQPHSTAVSVPSRNMEQKLKLSHRESPDFLLTDLHIQESPKEVIRPMPQHREKQDFQPSSKQQLFMGGDKGSQKPVSSLRQSYGRRHGSLDSLIDMIDKRASWASSDSEDGSDLLTSITTTFDQKLQILLNPKYKLTGAGRKVHKNDNAISESAMKMIEAPWQTDVAKSAPSHPKQTSYTMAALLDSDRSFQDPSLHRSAKSDPKIGIACRFERSDNVRAASSSPTTGSPLDSASNTSQSRKRDLPDFRSFLGKSAASSSQQRDLAAVVLTQPKKLDFENSGNGRGRVVRRNSSRSAKSDPLRPTAKSGNSNTLIQKGHGGHDAAVPSDLEFLNRGDKENMETPEQVRNRKNQHRRHTVGGAEDFEHISALTHINVNSNAGELKSHGGDNSSFSTQQQCPSAWEQLRPALKESGPGSMQAWIQRERLRGSTPDLSCKQENK